MQISPEERDLIARTVIGEAANQPPVGQLAVANVIRNRALSGRYGQSTQDVLFAPKQFEPWNTRRDELMSISPDSPQYKKAAALVDLAYSGGYNDPTNGATHFANIDTVRQRGNNRAMQWINSGINNGSAVKIGAHTFLNPDMQDGAMKPKAPPAPVKDEINPDEIVWDSQSGASPGMEINPNEIVWDEQPNQAVKRLQDGRAARLNSPLSGGVDAALRGVTQALLFGLADEAAAAAAASPTYINSSAPIAGAINTLLTPLNVAAGAGRVGLENLFREYIDPNFQGRGGATYDKVLETNRSLEAAASQDNPLSYIGGQIAGGSVVPIGGIKSALQGAGKVGSLAAAYGFGAGEGGIGNRLESAGTSGLVGAVAGGALGKYLGRQTAGAGDGSMAQAAASAEGLSLPKGVATDSSLLRGVAAKAANLPIVGTKLADGIDDVGRAVGSRVGDISSQLGGGVDRATLGGAARNAIDDAIGEGRVLAGENYDAVRGLLNLDAKTPLSATRAALDDILGARSAAADPNPKAGLERIVNAAEQKKLTFDGLQRLRSEVGALNKAFKRGAAPEGYVEGDFNRIYAALSDDLAGAVKNIAKDGKADEAAAAFQAANKNFSDTMKLNKELGSVLGRNSSDERIVQNIINLATDSGRGNIQRLGQIKSNIAPEEWNKIASFTLDNLGGSGDNFSPSKFATNWEKLSPAARDALFGKGGTDTRQHIDNLFTVSKRVQDFNKGRNWSGTAGAAMVAGGFYAMSDPIGALTQGLKAAGAGLALSYILARPATAASSGRFAVLSEKLAKATATGRPATINAAATSLARGAKNLAETINTTFGVKVSPEAFLKGQGSIPSAANNENTEPVGVGNN